MTEKEKFIYLFVIFGLVILLSFRLLNQGQNITEIIEKTQSEGINLLADFSLHKEPEIPSLDESFQSDDGSISFKYPSSWQKIEDESILSLFQSPQQEAELSLGANYDIENFNELQELAEQSFYEREIKSTFLFLGMRVFLPNFSVGLISLQEINIENLSSITELKEKLIKDLEKETDEERVSVKVVSVGDDFIEIETTTYRLERPIFFGKNIILIKDDIAFIFSLSSAYETWHHFDAEFNLIISSIELVNE